MFTKILVPVDGSGPSNAAVELALQLAKEDKAEVVFVHAVELNKIVALSGTAPIDPSFAIEAACSAGKALLEQSQEAAKKAGVRALCEEPEDECVSSVLEIARQKKADLIVVGSHGRSGIPRMLLGSVAEGILRQSKIPVLVCHAPSQADPHAEAHKLAEDAENSVL